METGYINNWHRVWSNRKLEETTTSSVLEKLISVDGFDSPLGMMQEKDWRDYVTMFAKRSGIATGDSIFEVGCGGGAFLYPFYEAGHTVSGIDYSGELVKVARSVMPDREAFLKEQQASECTDRPQDDVVIANHVIHYFPSMEYATTVLSTMLRKARKVITVSGVPDITLRAESEAARRGLLSAEEYAKKYNGLEILYFDKQWFADQAAANGFTAVFHEHAMPGFAQNPFRFDCVMTKNA